MEKLLANVLGQDASKLAARENQLLPACLMARFAHEVRIPRAGRTAVPFEIFHGELRRLENVVQRAPSLAGPSALPNHDHG